MTKRNTVILGLLILSVLALAGCQPDPSGVIQTVLTMVLGLAPIVAGAVAVILPGESAAILAMIPVVSEGLKALDQAYLAYKNSPSDSLLAELTAAFQSAQANIVQLENAARIKDPTLQREIDAIVTAAYASLVNIKSIILAKHPATVASAKESQGGA